jgi:twitching motility protein PilT
MLEHINETRQDHIITIEDPIEYIFKNKKSVIKQREVGEGKHSLSFSRALRAALREDPDVIFVGEMRDLETASLAITAAETGHLVFSTLHTNNTYQAVNRIIDMFPPYHQEQIRTQLSTSLVAIIAQRLIPRVNGGRVAALEIMLGNPAVKSLIRDNKINIIPNTIKTSRTEGMILLEDYLNNLIKQGIITQESARRFLKE